MIEKYELCFSPNEMEKGLPQDSTKKIRFVHSFDTKTIRIVVQ